jgi:large subunit ribosomal protein L25
VTSGTKDKSGKRGRKATPKRIEFFIINYIYFTMKSITIKGSERESVGKVATKALRNAGAVPCVLYGGDQPVHFSADEKAFKNLVYTPNAHTVVIETGNKTYNAILQDIQVHPVSDRILHVDFFQLNESKEITMEVPVKITGVSPGVLLGGVLRLNQRKLKVKALPKNLPDFVEADITPLEMGNKLYVTKLVSDKYKLMHPDNTVVAQVRISRAAMKAAQEAAKAAKAPAKGGKKK